MASSVMRRRGMAQLNVEKEMDGWFICSVGVERFYTMLLLHQGSLSAARSVARYDRGSGESAYSEWIDLW